MRYTMFRVFAGFVCSVGDSCSVYFNLRSIMTNLLTIRQKRMEKLLRARRFFQSHREDATPRNIDLPSPVSQNWGFFGSRAMSNSMSTLSKNIHEGGLSRKASSEKEGSGGSSTHGVPKVQNTGRSVRVSFSLPSRNVEAKSASSHQQNHSPQSPRSPCSPFSVEETSPTSAPGPTAGLTPRIRAREDDRRKMEDEILRRLSVISCLAIFLGVAFSGLIGWMGVNVALDSRSYSEYYEYEETHYLLAVDGAMYLHAGVIFGILVYSLEKSSS
uniref:Uncharacterized protein n=2 Tax=Lotharella globosa TaxID=91324 RepID=A0A7S4DH88_9EUKA|mmetsp:Transcript_20198/g.40769  ORF Transcript_20198/g.40769 Transcript_20198/m.40769 type:complete len:272 (+) Transcript_20198:555-1370(+)